MKAVVTLNVGNWMADNARRSQRAAATRWGYEYIELVSPAEDVFIHKHRSLSQLTCFERVLWLDADVVVRSDCRCAWEHGDETAIVGVRGAQHDTTEEYAKTTVSWWDAVNLIRGMNYPFHLDLYFNGGAFAFTPRLHAPMFDWVARMAREGTAAEHPYVDPMMEQTMLNLAPAVFGWPVFMLPETYNRVGLEAWDSPTMDAYVYHLAGLPERRRDKRERLEEIEWDVMARVPVEA